MNPEAHSGGDEKVTLDSLASDASALSRPQGHQIEALELSILSLWAEAGRCCSLGLYEACILACGAVIERCLKREYERERGANLRGRWTLGRCVYELDWDGILAPDILERAKSVLSPLRGRAHALLEHCDPYLALLADSPGQLESRASESSLIEGYQEEAEYVLATTSDILRRLHAISPIQA